MIKKAKNKIFVTAVFIMAVAVVFTYNTLCYFDNPKYRRIENIAIGQWDFMTETATYQAVSDLINYKYDSKKPEELQIINYLGSLLLDSGTKTVNKVFEQYKMYEVDETIEIIDKYISDFLVFNNGVLSYQASAAPVTLNFKKTLAYGESFIINQVLLTADLLSNEALTVTLNMSAQGVDISDFSAEILIDRNAFAVSSPFVYDYKHTGMNSPVSVRANKVNLQSLKTAAFNTSVKRKKITTTYNHTINAPDFTGDYARFPSGPLINLTAPSNFTLSKKTVAGVYLRGSADGSDTQLSMNISNMVSRYYPGVTVVPIKIVISRGVSNDGSSINQANIMPVITMKITG